MGYKSECDRCGETTENPLLMGQFHEEQFMTDPSGDRLKEAGYDLSTTLTFCRDCVLTILAHGR